MADQLQVRGSIYCSRKRATQPFDPRAASRPCGRFAAVPSPVRASRACDRLARVLNPQAPDAKKEEFRKYLGNAGVIDALTKVLVGLYEEPEKPQNAIDFIKMTLGAPSGVDVDALKAENEQLKQRVDELELKLAEANKKLEEGSPAE